MACAGYAWRDRVLSPAVVVLHVRLAVPWAEKYAAEQPSVLTL
jgi:hypothetical protein